MEKLPGMGKEAMFPWFTQGSLHREFGSRQARQQGHGSRVLGPITTRSWPLFSLWVGEVGRFFVVVPFS